MAPNSADILSIMSNKSTTAENVCDAVIGVLQEQAINPVKLKASDVLETVLEDVDMKTLSIRQFQKLLQYTYQGYDLKYSEPKEGTT